MIIQKVLFEPFALQFKEPFVFGKNTLTHKQGFHLSVHFEKYSAKGEVTILEPFGTPSADEAASFFPEVESFLLHRNPIDILSDLVSAAHSFPAVVESAVEQSVISLICNTTGVSPAELLNRSYAEKVKINGVISTSDPLLAVAAARRIIQNGITTIKLKVASGSFENDLEKITLMREHFGDQIIIRLDANGNWSLEEAMEFLPKLEKFDIAYIEQPVRDCNEFSRVRESTSIKLAADECVEDFQTAARMIKERIADVMIIKPLLLGGIRKSAAIARLADEAGISTVITTSLDGAVGRRAAVVTAAILNSDMSHGLSTGALFKHDPEPDYYIPQDGYIYTHDLRM